MISNFIEYNNIPMQWIDFIHNNLYLILSMNKSMIRLLLTNKLKQTIKIASSVWAPLNPAPNVCIIAKKYARARAHSLDTQYE